MLKMKMLRKILDYTDSYPVRPADKQFEPDKPAYGSMRISPVGTDGFAVDRYEVADEPLRVHPSAWWTRKFTGTKEECEQWVKNFLYAVSVEEEYIRKHNEAVRKHYDANPPRIIVTLADFK